MSALGKSPCVYTRRSNLLQRKNPYVVQQHFWPQQAAAAQVRGQQASGAAMAEAMAARHREEVERLEKAHGEARDEVASTLSRHLPTSPTARSPSLMHAVTRGLALFGRCGTRRRRSTPPRRRNPMEAPPLSLRRTSLLSTPSLRRTSRQPMSPRRTSLRRMPSLRRTNR